MDFKEFINNLPTPLSSDEQAQYFIAMHEGDKSARDTLIEHNLWRVKNVLKNQFEFISKEEINRKFSDGVAGLINAIDKFNTESTSSFQRFASSRIYSAIVHGPEQEDLNFLNRDEKTLLVDSNLMAQKNMYGYNFNLFERLEEEELIDKLHNALDRLSIQEKEIIKLRFEDNLTIHEIAEHCELSDSTIEAIIKKSLMELRSILCNEFLEYYDDVSLEVVEKLLEKIKTSYIRTLKAYNKAQLGLLFECIHLLNSYNEVLLKDYLGLNDTHESLTMRMMTEKYDCAVSNISFKVRRALKELKEIITWISANKDTDDLSESVVEKLQESNDMYVRTMISRLDKSRIKKFITLLEVLPSLNGAVLKAYLGLDEEGIPKSMNFISSKLDINYNMTRDTINSSLKDILYMLNFWNSAHEDVVLDIIQELLTRLTSPIKYLIPILKENQKQAIKEYMQYSVLDIYLDMNYYLGFYDGVFYDINEIAYITGRSTQTVKKHLMLALLKMKKVMIDEKKEKTY